MDVAGLLHGLHAGPARARAKEIGVATLFTRIINGEIPGRFVHRDEHCVAFLSIHPLSPGHTLVVPIEEVDHWLDLSAELTAHLMEVARRIGRAQQKAFNPVKVGLMVAGLEVPHVHIHVVPIRSEGDLDFKNADTGASGHDLEVAAGKLRDAL